MLHPIIGVRIRTRQYPFRSRAIKHKNIPGQFFFWVITLLGKVINPKTPEIPKMLNPRIIQINRCFLSSKTIVAWKDGRPENKNSQFRIDQFLQNLSDFRGPPKTMTSGWRENKYQAGFRFHRVEGR